MNTNMRRFYTFWICVVGSLLLQAPNRAMGDVNPYLSIPERNAFGLRPPPPPPEVTQPVIKEPPPKVFLTGITILSRIKKAWFNVADSKFPNDPTKAKNVSLREGQQSGTLEVLQIFEKTGSVNVLNSGQEMMLSFKNNSGKSVAINVPGAAPPLAAMPMFNGRPPPPSAVPNPMPEQPQVFPGRSRFGIQPPMGMNPSQGVANGQYNPGAAGFVNGNGQYQPVATPGYVNGNPLAQPTQPQGEQDPAVAVARAIQNLEALKAANAAATANGQYAPPPPPLPPLPEN